MTLRQQFSKAQDSGDQLLDNQANVSPLFVSDYPFGLWVGYDASGLAVAYFETPEPLEQAFTVSQSISVEGVQTYNFATQQHIEAIKVICLSAALNEVFYFFLEGVLDKLSTNPDPVETLNSTAYDWRSLLQVATIKLSTNSALGLYGELNFLEKAVRELGPQALNHWQLSPNEIHDFIFGNIRAEVKTSAFQNNMSVTVHGLKQLEKPAESSLTLAVAEVQKHGNGEHLHEIVARLLDSGVDREMLTEKLQNSGYVMGMPGVEDLRFQILSWRFWPISSESSVLSVSKVSPEIRDAVANLKYDLNLVALGNPLTEFDWTAVQLHLQPGRS